MSVELICPDIFSILFDAEPVSLEVDSDIDLLIFFSYELGAGNVNWWNSEEVYFWHKLGMLYCARKDDICVCRASGALSSSLLYKWLTKNVIHAHDWRVINKFLSQLSMALQLLIQPEDKERGKGKTQWFSDALICITQLCMYYS